MRRNAAHGSRTTIFCWRAALFAAILVASAEHVSAAPKKIGFFVGVGNIPAWGSKADLPRSINGAKAMATLFTGFGYDQTTVVTNPTGDEFIDKWSDFLATIDPGDDVVFYFSGHGIEIEGDGYLILHNAPAKKYGDTELLRFRSIKVDYILSSLRKKKPRLAVVFFDACRDNPFIPPQFQGIEKGDAFAPGLGKVSPIKRAGFYTMFAARPDEQAIHNFPDEDPAEPNANTLFTRILIKTLSSSVPLHDLGKAVADGVAQEAQERLGKNFDEDWEPPQWPTIVDETRGIICLDLCAKSYLPTVQPVIQPSKKDECDPAVVGAEACLKMKAAYIWNKTSLEIVTGLTSKLQQTGCYKDKNIPPTKECDERFLQAEKIAERWRADSQKKLSNSVCTKGPNQDRCESAYQQSIQAFDQFRALSELGR